MSSTNTDYTTRPSTRPTPPSTSSRPVPPSFGGDGSNYRSSGDSYSHSRSGRPTPPPIDRPTPPPVDRPVPPPVDPGYADPTRPVPPAVHVPRYYWQPTFPVMLPSNPQPIPQIPLHPSPAPARKVDKNEVSNDVVDLLAGYGRLRDQKKVLFVTTHPQLNTQQAKSALSSGKTIYLAPDDGMHQSDKYQPINNISQLQPLLPQVQQQKLNDLQANENRAYDQRVNQWVDQDVQHRVNNLPAFN